MATSPAAKLPPKTIPNPEFMADEAVRDAVEEAISTQYLTLHMMRPSSPRYQEVQVRDEKGRFAEKSKVRIDSPFDAVEGMRSEVWSALPERGGCEIPEEGSWVIVKRVPHTELSDRFEVPVWSIWRARPHYRNREFRLKQGRRTIKVQWPCLLGIINTPGGELWLYPGEYVSTDIETWLKYIGRGVDVHFLGAGEPGDLKDQVFYLQSHGIRRSDAMLMVLPGLAEQDFCYFTFNFEDSERGSRHGD